MLHFYSCAIILIFTYVVYANINAFHYLKPQSNNSSTRSSLACFGVLQSEPA